MEGGCCCFLSREGFILFVLQLGGNILLSVASKQNVEHQGQEEEALKFLESQD